MDWMFVSMPAPGLRSIRRYKKEAIMSSQSIAAELVGHWRILDATLEPLGGRFLTHSKKRPKPRTQQRLTMSDIIRHDFDFVANETRSETELAPKRQAVECQTDNQR